VPGPTGAAPCVCYSSRRVVVALRECPDENRLVALVEGRLGDDDVSTLEQHVDRCIACQTLLDELGAVLSPATAQPTTGASIGRYQVLEPLGAGAMGVVYAAWDPQLRRKVALKLLRPDLALGVDIGAARARLLREARLLASLSHPNIVAVYDAGAHGDDVFMAVELVEGRPLSQWAADANASWQDVLEVYVQAARGLGAAHGAGLVHRDVKPANIMLGDDGRVRVTDFGLAAAVNAAEASGVRGHGQSETSLQTASGVVVGTPAYMAPEQWSGGKAGPRADQYSFCVALGEALTGERPSAGATAEDFAEVAERNDKTAPPALWRLVARGLAARPRDRHPDMEALAIALEPLLKRRGGVAAPPSRRRTPPRWSWILAAVAGAAIALTGARLMSRDAAPGTRVDVPDPRPLVELEPVPSPSEAEPLVAEPVPSELTTEVVPGPAAEPGAVAVSGAPDAPAAALAASSAEPAEEEAPTEDGSAKPHAFHPIYLDALRAADWGDPQKCLAKLSELASTAPEENRRSQSQKLRARCQMLTGDCEGGRKRLAAMLGGRYQGAELERAIDAHAPPSCRKTQSSQAGTSEAAARSSALATFYQRALDAKNAKDVAKCRTIRDEVNAYVAKEGISSDQMFKPLADSALVLVTYCLADKNCAEARKVWEQKYRTLYPELMTPDEYDVNADKMFYASFPQCKK
jgi:serine/threonine protein kinase